MVFGCEMCNGIITCICDILCLKYQYNIEYLHMVYFQEEKQPILNNTLPMGYVLIQNENYKCGGICSMY